LQAESASANTHTTDNMRDRRNDVGNLFERI